MNIWKYIKADTFFKDYLPHIKSHKFKIRGANSRNNPTDFSKEEKKEIIKAFEKLSKNISHSLKQFRKAAVKTLLSILH